MTPESEAGTLFVTRAASDQLAQRYYGRNNRFDALVGQRLEQPAGSRRLHRE
jgi:hypothetical protein